MRVNASLDTAHTLAPTGSSSVNATQARIFSGNREKPFFSTFIFGNVVLGRAPSYRARAVQITHHGATTGGFGLFGYLVVYSWRVTLGTDTRTVLRAIV